MAVMVQCEYSGEGLKKRPEAKRRRRAYFARFNPYKPDGPSSTLESSHGVSWERNRLLGKGGFGYVFLARRRKKRAGVLGRQENQEAGELPLFLAVKSATSVDSLSLVHEKRVFHDLQRGSCPYILKCYGREVAELTSGDKIYNLLLEYCSGFNLEHWIIDSGTGLPESHVKRYVRDIVKGLKYIHGRGYVHCDIKPSNILLVPIKKRMPTGYLAKIGDFGLAMSIKEGEEGEKIEGMRGTPSYMSPELVREKQIGYGADIWALGCSMVEMLSGKSAWYSAGGNQSVNGDALLHIIGYTDYLPQLPSSASNDALDFMSKCLCRNPQERWSAEKLLGHPFLYREDPKRCNLIVLD
ncbi:hypothetical protein Tsubulata_028626 [Turnera subulata]|uniref:Protein kinase domain-containing protein n=1 Tax=Turnera subulata TaxID=218843 RepID=A0A9Q0FLL6_9ROSI|nr:hypothetical protein Tsubulata_028626 [Turnera subulata]